MNALRDTMRRQSGVVSRRQVLEARASDDDIDRHLRRREWARIHPGVYVNHTGPPTWEQRAWAAVLHHWPSALGGFSALRAYGLTGSSETTPIHLVVPRGRRVRDPTSIRTRQLADFEQTTLMHLSPPRVRIEYAVLDVASQAPTVDGAVAVLADAVQERRTTPSRLRGAMVHRPRLRHRQVLKDVLRDLDEGANSGLERRYLRAVERAHGLPRGKRQRQVVTGSVTYRDVEYDEQQLVVELDGRLGHEFARDRWSDLQRDLDSAARGDLTVRLGWHQILSPCRTAYAVARLLVARGWSGRPRPCGPECPIRGDKSAQPADLSPLIGDSPTPAATEPSR